MGAPIPPGQLLLTYEGGWNHQISRWQVAAENKKELLDMEVMASGYLVVTERHLTTKHQAS